MRDVQPQTFIVRLSCDLDLPVKAQTTEEALNAIARLHPAIERAVQSVGSDDTDMTEVRGRCATKKCRRWVLLKKDRHPLATAKILCEGCRTKLTDRGGNFAKKREPEGEEGMPPHFEPPNRKGGPKDHGDREGFGTNVEY